MKILHIGKYYHPIAGGIEAITEFVIKSLHDDTHTIISFNDSHKSVTERIDGIDIVRAGVLTKIASQPLSLSYFMEIRRAIGRFKPDVVHFHYPNPLGALYLLLLKKKFKLVIHWHSDVVSQKILSRFVFPVEQMILDRADSVIVTSPTYGKMSSGLRNHRDKLSVIPCSINETRFKLDDKDRSEVEMIRRKYDNRKIILFLGRHVKYKGLRYLLEAEKLVREDCVLLIAGEGPMTESLKNEFTSERVYWLGQLTDNQRKIYYSAADIFAFPSITPNEAFGIALLEAMYCGLPAVTFTIPKSGVNWVSIDQLTGLEAPNRNVPAYAASLDRLLSDGKLRAQLGANARERVTSHYVKDIVSRYYQEFYRDLMQEKPKKQI